VAISGPIVHPLGDIQYKHGKPWWNEIDRGKLLFHPAELSGKPTSNYQVAKQEELVKEMMNFALQSISFKLQRVNMP
jgi:hypothetical protein